MHKTTCLVPLQVKSSSGMRRFSNFIRLESCFCRLQYWCNRVAWKAEPFCRRDGGSFPRLLAIRRTVSLASFCGCIDSSQNITTAPSDLCAASDVSRSGVLASCLCARVHGPTLCRRSPPGCASFPTADLAGIKPSAVFPFRQAKVCSFLQVPAGVS